MRDFKGMKRQRGRNRGGGNAPNGGGKPQQNINRAFDSNGPENVKIRGHAQHVFEKYQQLARDAFSSGDRVLAENYLQHADHYFRVLRTIQPNRAPSEILGRDVFASGLDIDFEDEGEGFEDSAEGGELPEMNAEVRFEGRETRAEGRSENGRYDAGRSDNVRLDAGRQDNGRQEGGRQDGRREDRYDSRTDRLEPRRDGAENGRYESRRDSQDTRDGKMNGRRDYAEARDGIRTEGLRDDFGAREPRAETRRDFQDRDSRNDRREGQDRGEPRREPRGQQTLRGSDAAQMEGGRVEGSRAEGGRAESGRSEIGRDGEEPRRSRAEGRREREPREERRYGQSSEEDLVAAPDPLAVIKPDAAPLPLTSQKASEVEPSPVLRSEDGGVSEAPAFLQTAIATSPVEPAEDAEVRKPRARRRRPKALETAEAEERSATGSPDAIEEA